MGCRRDFPLRIGGGTGYDKNGDNENRESFSISPIWRLEWRKFADFHPGLRDGFAHGDESDDCERQNICRIADYSADSDLPYTGIFGN
ncbi:MAG: hypothetical protein ABI690_11275 [Chloroflexota bacterium]